MPGRSREAITKLQAVRLALGYSQDDTLRRLRSRAAERGLAIASHTSLRTMLSRWENGHDEVTEPDYQLLFREVYGRTNEELGFAPEPEDGSLTELRERLSAARSIDHTTIELFRRQVDDLRHLDRRLGAVPLLDQLNSQITELDKLLRYSAAPTDRAALAEVLADAAMLAGWEALDRGSLKLAWQHHEVAKSAAREAGSAALLAYATGQQAFILIELEMYPEAVQLLEDADAAGRGKTAGLLRTWLAAARGEGLAAHGQSDEALRAFDAAESLLPLETDDPDLPFLMLNPGHLARWRGHALSRLRDRRAVSELEIVLNGLNPTTARARAGTLADLAFAHAAIGNRDAAIHYARQARQLASQIGSERQKRRLARLLLPTVPHSEIQQNRHKRP
jgi:transcriptional regulator with XRE-family HTH domain